MPTTERPDGSADQSRKRGAGLSRVAYANGRSPEAERMWERRVEDGLARLLDNYRHRGNRSGLLRLLGKVRTAVDTGPTLPLDQALLAEGRQDRHQDEARELCLQGASHDVKQLYIARSYREIDTLLAAIRAVEATLA